MMIFYILLAVGIVYTILELIYYEIQKTRFFKKLKKFDFITYNK